VKKTLSVYPQIILAALALLAVNGSARAQEADFIFVNGKILTVDPQFSVRQAIAIRESKIVSVGTNADIRKNAGSKTRTIDLQGRTVIPGLIDSHIHASRAGLTFDSEINWTDATSLQEALGRIADMASKSPPGAWMVVAGGWNPHQFKEDRRPTQADLAAAAPNNPVYVQFNYAWVLLSQTAMQALHIASEADLPRGATLEKDAGGKPTGIVNGGVQALYTRIPTRNFDEEIESSRKFFRELNRLGLTGVVDPGVGASEDNQVLFTLWKQGQLTVRFNYNHSIGDLAELKALTEALPMGFGDDMLRFNGIGEGISRVVTDGVLGTGVTPEPSNADKQQFYEIVKWAAEHRLSLTIHWQHDQSVDRILTIFERVNQQTPIAGLRWTIAHLNNASQGTLERMKALGVGWTVQDALYLGSELFEKDEGLERAKSAPPIMTATRVGVAMGGGTDATRVSPYNPFRSLQWFVDGHTAGARPLRIPQETPSRSEALRLYTMGSAWVAFAEKDRGSLEPGKLADLAVLSKDYMNVPTSEIGSIESLLTMVGGKVVFAAGPYAQFEEKR